MKPMTTHERFTRMFEHKEADRIPFFDYPWGATIERWQKEGMPADVSWIDYFDLDKVWTIASDISPRYEEKIIEETDEYVIKTTGWGATTKDFKHSASVPEFLDFTITDREKWNHAKERMVPSRDRIDWNFLKNNYRRMREEGYWICGQLWFGFDVSHSWAVGTERFLMAMFEDPDWCNDMFQHYLDMCLAHWEMILAEGYTVDAFFWPDDMGYKGHQFFSVDTYRMMLKPFHKRAVDWAHSHGIKAHLHSCGDIRPLVPELIDIGLDALNPLEVKAGVDTLEMKRLYGKDLVLHGGINALHWNHPDIIMAEIEEKIPVLKENGGYIFASDHSIPSAVSLEDFGRIIARVKELGSY